MWKRRSPPGSRIFSSFLLIPNLFTINKHKSLIPAAMFASYFVLTPRALCLFVRARSSSILLYSRKNATLLPFSMRYPGSRIYFYIQTITTTHYQHSFKPIHRRHWHFYTLMAMLYSYDVLITWAFCHFKLEWLLSSLFCSHYAPIICVLSYG